MSPISNGPHSPFNEDPLKFGTKKSERSVTFDDEQQNTSDKMDESSFKEVR